MSCLHCCFVVSIGFVGAPSELRAAQMLSCIWRASSPATNCMRSMSTNMALVLMCAQLLFSVSLRACGGHVKGQLHHLFEKQEQQSLWFVSNSTDRLVGGDAAVLGLLR